MALYAFDGTWNEDSEDEGGDTNVIKFRELYIGHSTYLSGVGTRGGRLGKVFGGLFGTGGRTRIREMSEALAENWKKGDKDIDIIGFSRGAALAVHFANKLEEDGVELDKGETIKPKVRFLGVWDIVGSFGLSFDTIINFQKINLGWDIDRIGKNVDKCCHAMALDERRETFDVTRLDPEHQFDNIDERWFRGVHSDVGGGNQNPLRSNIPLQWMLQHALDAGVPIDMEKAKQDKYSKTDPAAKISENKDVKIDPRRKVFATDDIDASAQPLKLSVGVEHTCTVLAELKYNWSGVALEKGGKYKVSTAPGDKWADDEIIRGPEGWATLELDPVDREFIKLFESRRRHPHGNWMELIGSYGDEDDHLIRLGEADQGCEFEAKHNADLYLFANDLKKKYDNNGGDLQVTITRTA